VTASSSDRAPRRIEGRKTMAEALRKATAAHKYDHGHALVLSGGMGRTGAARLAARAALRVGAGLVTVLAPGAAMMECACHLTAIMLRRCDNADDLSEQLQDMRLNALCLGPGLGVGGATPELVVAALRAGRAAVLDADALTSFAKAPETLFSALHGEVVLTPHDGEFVRLFPDLTVATGHDGSRVMAVRAAAARAGCVVLLKGARTLIATPAGTVWENDATGARATPWLATAGSGDVLAGLITGLMARGLCAEDAAGSAAWLHVEAARSFGPGLIAEDLPETLPRVFRSMGL